MMVPEEGDSTLVWGGTTRPGHSPKNDIVIFDNDTSPGDSDAGRTHMTICFLCSRKSTTCEQVGWSVAQGEERVYMWVYRMKEVPILGLWGE